MHQADAKAREPLHAAQREVQRKLGGCMIHIQQYEIQLKALVARQEIAGPPAHFNRILARNIATTSTRTLGQLIGDLTNGYLQSSRPDSHEAATTAVGDEPWFSLRFHMEMSSEAYEAICQQLSGLVTLRNGLVHHFIERFNLMSEAGCTEAQAYLDDCYKTIDAHFVALKAWAATADEVRTEVAARITAPGFWKDDA